MKSIAAIAVLFSVLILSGCSREQADGLIGTWQTELIPSEWGSNQITVTYFSDGRVAGTNAFPGEGALDWNGTFRLRGDVIERTIDGRTQEFLFRIEGDTMYQKMGDEDYTFRRVLTSAWSEQEAVVKRHRTMHPFWPSFAVFFIMLCISSWYHWRFLRSVRRKFPSLWQDMGSPTSWTDSTLFDAFGTYSYLFQRRYHKRANTDETKFCEQFRMPMLVTYAATIVSASVFFLGLLVWGKP